MAKLPNEKRRIFWDIESYDNLFLVGMIDENNRLEMHYLVNDKRGEQEVLAALRNSPYQFKAYNLAVQADVLRNHFFKYDNQTGANGIVNDFLKGKNENIQAPKISEDDRSWYFGYNTLNYDIPMIDFALSRQQAGSLNITPKALRAHSDEIIAGEREGKSSGYLSRDYARYAGQVDCALLNEKMVEKGRPTVGLKTLVGIRGGSIIESDSNKSGHSNNIYEDTLYNINDVSELRDVVFPGLMEETFNIRRNLLTMFPQLLENGLTVNSTSANFVENIVAPAKAIDDDPVVNFTYPAPHIAKRLQVPRTDILDDTKAWYDQYIYQRIKKHNPQAAEINKIKFHNIIKFYQHVRGSNWNNSAKQAGNVQDKINQKINLKFQELSEQGLAIDDINKRLASLRTKMETQARPKTKLERKALFEKFGTFLPLLDANGKDSYTYVNFSLGGIHGAEINHEQLLQDRKKIKELREKYHYISKIPAKQVSSQLKNLIKAQSRTTYVDTDGSYTGKPGTVVPQCLTHEIPDLFHKTQESDEILRPEDFTPFLCTKGGKQVEQEQLIKRYKYTSIGDSVHQDFAGYYPMCVTR